MLPEAPGWGAGDQPPSAQPDLASGYVWVGFSHPTSPALPLCTPSGAAVLGEAAVQIWRHWSKDAALKSIGVIYVIVKVPGGGE